MELSIHIHVTVLLHVIGWSRNETTLVGRVSCSCHLREQLDPSPRPKITPSVLTFPIPAARGLTIKIPTRGGPSFFFLCVCVQHLRFGKNNINL